METKFKRKVEKRIKERKNDTTLFPFISVILKKRNLNLLLYRSSRRQQGNFLLCMP